MKSPDPRTGVLLFTWQTHWVSFVALAVQVGGAGVVPGQRPPRGARGGAVVDFQDDLLRASGSSIVAYATEGGIAHYQTSNFTAHVVQVLLLVDVAPPLLALGAPITLALQSSSRRTAATLVGVLRSGPVQIVSRPSVAFVIAMGSMFVYFLTPSLPCRPSNTRSCLLWSTCTLVLVGLLLWVLIVGQDGLPRRLSFGMRFVLVLLLIPFNLALGLAVASVTQPLYPAGNTLADTQQGGNVLLGLAEVLIVAALALLFVEWAREEERSAVRNDRQLDAALAAARAAIGPSESPAPPGNGATSAATAASYRLGDDCRGRSQNLRADNSGIQRSDRVTASFQRRRRSSPAGSTIGPGCGHAPRRPRTWTRDRPPDQPIGQLRERWPRASGGNFHRALARIRQFLHEHGVGRHASVDPQAGHRLASIGFGRLEQVSAPLSDPS